jgi:hypothetical protein
MLLQLASEGPRQPFVVFQKGSEDAVEKEQVELSFEVPYAFGENFPIGVLNLRLGDWILKMIQELFSLLVIDEFPHAIP